MEWNFLLRNDLKNLFKNSKAGHMQNLIKTGRAFYGIGLAGIGLQQFIYADFRPVILPEWPSWIPWLTAWAYLAGTALIIAGAVIIFSKKARKTALVLGVAFLFFFVAFHLTYQLFFSPYSFHLGLWTDPLKELAFSGGAFVIAGSYPEEKLLADKSPVDNLMDAFIAIGSIFFSVTMIVFGMDHFLYTEFVATLVPGWMPWHVFWTYFAGVALIGAGICIIFKIQLKLVGLLLGIMLFIWFVILHIPRAVVDPYVDKGNEVTSVFEALAFSGIAFMISCMPMGNIKQGEIP
ncbi:MAG: hypothetical protein ABI472_18505 [Ginsengibacter sp.]